MVIFHVCYILEDKKMPVNFFLADYGLNNAYASELVLRVPISRLDNAIRHLILLE